MPGSSSRGERGHSSLDRRFGELNEVGPPNTEPEAEADAEADGGRGAGELGVGWCGAGTS